LSTEKGRAVVDHEVASGVLAERKEDLVAGDTQGVDDRERRSLTDLLRMRTVDSHIPSVKRKPDACYRKPAVTMSNPPE
jgi:hypothetical protein